MAYLAKEDIIQKTGGAHVFGRIVDFDHVFQTVGQLLMEHVPDLDDAVHDFRRQQAETLAGLDIEEAQPQHRAFFAFIGLIEIPALKALQHLLIDRNIVRRHEGELLEEGVIPRQIGEDFHDVLGDRVAHFEQGFDQAGLAHQRAEIVAFDDRPD